MAEDRLDLEGGCIITRLPKEEREHALSQNLLYGAIGGFSHSDATFGLECRLSCPKTIGHLETLPTPSTGLVRERFDEICAALRLYKAGFVACDQIRKESTSWTPGGGTTMTGLGRSHVLGGSYLLDGDEAVAFAAFWKAYKSVSIRKQPGVAMALRRFGFAYERQRPEDKLVDYCIAFEALLLLEEERAELEHRLALRGSRLVGHDSAMREAVYLELRAAYGARSKVVHGGRPPNEVKRGQSRVPLAEFTDNLEALLRQCVKAVLTQHGSIGQKEMIQLLDRAVIRGDT